MYATELRTQGWSATPRALRSVVLAGLLAGLLAIAASAFASFRADAAVDRVEQEGLERAFYLCSAQNESRAGIRFFVDALVRRDGTVDLWEQEALALANETFAPLTCPPDPSPQEDS